MYLNILLASGKKKGKKKRDLVKDGGKDNQLPPAILFLQCHVYLAEGLTMVIGFFRFCLLCFQCSQPAKLFLPFWFYRLFHICTLQ